MPHIQVLDQITIDKIAAGEVIERPASIVKELVENAIDADATAVVVEIQEGGISFIRITDNGKGIPREDVPNAFLRHSTSKIRSVEDLTHVASLGFRGEALSSIAAVTKTELITKTREETFGTRYVIEGGRELSIEDTGAPDGTTFLIRQLFYNVPARRKFLKTPMTEAGHIQDLLMRLALSHPEVSFQFLNNGQEKLRTAGNGKLKDVIYSIYGREVAANLIAMDYELGGLHITGFLGKPLISRGNRNFENFFINGRYVKSSMISKAIEDAYRDFVMQHKFPFVVLHFQIDGEDIDVNVHPTKMELRFQKQQEVYSTVYEGVHRTLLEPELIPVVDVPSPKMPSTETPVSGNPAHGNSALEAQEEDSPFLLKPKALKNAMPGIGRIPTRPAAAQDEESTASAPGSIGTVRAESSRVSPSDCIPSGEKASPENAMQQERKSPEERDEEYFLQRMRERVLSYHNKTASVPTEETKTAAAASCETKTAAMASAETLGGSDIKQPDMIRETGNYHPGKEVLPEASANGADTESKSQTDKPVYTERGNTARKLDVEELGEAKQIDLFEEKLLKRDIRAEYKLIGQVFDTYWLVQFGDNLYIIDQHAAHERVLYERTLRGMKSREFTSQYLSPPIILSLSMQESALLNEHMDRFQRIGFEIEPFGGDEYAVRAVPDNLFSIAKKELLLEMLDGLADGVSTTMTPELIDEKVASMSCKAAVKGNNKLSAMEVDSLIGELLGLDNPYHCPHGRPTIIAMTKRELEKKFKRIV